MGSLTPKGEPKVIRLDGAQREQEQGLEALGF